MNRIAYKNQYTREHYDRVNLTLPKGQKDRIRDVCMVMGVSVNEYLFMLICDDLQGEGSKLAKKKQGFSDSQKAMLDKWQVARKYHEMIEDMSYTKEEGYFIYLKDDYINDITGSRSIHCDKTTTLRRIITHTHKK